MERGEKKKKNGKGRKKHHLGKSRVNFDYFDNYCVPVLLRYWRYKDAKQEGETPAGRGGQTNGQAL